MPKSKDIVFSGFATFEKIQGVVTHLKDGERIGVETGGRPRYWQDVTVPLDASAVLRLAVAASGEPIIVTIEDGRVESDPAQEMTMPRWRSLVFQVDA